MTYGESDFLVHSLVLIHLDQHCCLAFKHRLIMLIYTHCLEGNDGLVVPDSSHDYERSHRIARENRLHKPQCLAQIDRTLTRQFVSENRRDERSAQHAVSDA